MIKKSYDSLGRTKLDEGILEECVDLENLSIDGIEN
jgi:hypothetical protein